MALLAPVALAGKLDRVSQEAHSPSSSGSSSSSSSNSSSGSSCSGSGDSSSDTSGADGALAIVMVVTSPWWGPNYILEHDKTELSVGFVPYPYASGHAGLLDIDNEPAPDGQASTIVDLDGYGSRSRPPVHKKNWAVQLGAESGYVFDRVWREGLKLRLQTAYRIEFDASWSLFMEREVGAFDNLVLGREHFIWRFAQSNAVQFRTALGAQHLIDARGDESGIDVEYGLDAFPGRPVVMSLEGAVGNLGAAFAPRVRATLGIMTGRFELAFGYEHEWIGRESLGGPFAMWRIWL